jgi:hypothetical protein
MQVNELIERIS